MSEKDIGAGDGFECPLRLLVKEAVLAGNTSVTSIMKHIGQSDDDTRKEIVSFLNDGMFRREVMLAQTNIEETIIKWFKHRALSYAKNMDSLALCEDPRVKFQANKDALDRIGTRPEERVRVSGIDAYKQLIQELLPDSTVSPSGKKAVSGEKEEK